MSWFVNALRGQCGTLPGVNALRGQCATWPGVNAVRGQGDTLPGVAALRGESRPDPLHAQSQELRSLSIRHAATIG